MNYLEEQRNEIEALRWIYPEEMNVLEEDPFYSISIRVSTESSKAESTSCNLRFTFTAKYPDEIPEMEFESDDNVDESDAELLRQFMQEVAASSLGMAMVYTIASAVQEKLLCIVDEAVERKAMEKERLEKEREEAERKRFEGTLVTVETFLAWKEKFGAELARRKGAKALDGPRRLTGRELFLQDHTLDDSDLRFVEDVDALPVDESLFENVDDLDLEDDDSGDGDYVPGASDSDEDDN